MHASYIAAGAELIETHTFGANRRKLARVLLDGDFEQINSAGVDSPARRGKLPAETLRRGVDRAAG